MCLDHLARLLDGDQDTGTSSAVTPEWRAVYDDYVARGMPVPGG